MKFLQVYLFIALFTITCIPFSYSQTQHVYTLKTQTADIPSSEFRKDRPEMLINQAKALAATQLDSALILVGNALLISRELDLHPQEAQSLRRMGLLLYRQDDLVSALHYLHRSEEVYENLDDVSSLRKLYNNLGVIYEGLGKQQRAIDYYFKSLTQAEIEENIPKQITALSNLGVLSNQSKQYKSAEEYLTRALTLLQSLEDKSFLPRLQFELGSVYIYLKDFEKAEYYLQEAFEHYTINKTKEEDFRALANCYNAFGFIAEAKKDYEGARKYYNQALAIYQELESPDIAIGYSNLGSLNVVEGKSKKAIFYFKKALDLPSIQSFKEKELYLNLSIAYSQLKVADSAYYFQDAYTYLSDSIYESEIQETTSRAELLYQKARTERLEAEAQRVLDKQKMFSNYLMGGIFIVGLLALVFYLLMRNYAQRKEKLAGELKHKEESNKLLLVEMLKDHEVETLNAMLDGQELERKRIARDLHDSMGGTLAAIQLTLASLERKIPDMTEVAQSTYQKAESLLDQAYNQMRGIAHNLADLNLKDGGLSPALAQLKDTLAQNTEIDIHMNYESLGERRLDSNVEQHSYRITQELFQNIIKHAEASQIEYELNYSPLKLQISIRDDGKGFVYDPGSKVSGIGLNNIMTRVRQLDGEMDINTQPGKGTRIEVDIPLVLS